MIRNLATGLATALAAVSIAFPAAAAVTISSKATINMTCSGGVCTPTNKEALLNAGDLEALLASGNVTVKTTGSGVQARNIEIRAALTWTSTSVLTLDAYHSVTIDKPVSITGLAGLTIADNDGGSGGVFSFAKEGNVAFADLLSELMIDGTPFQLENDLKTLASAIARKPAGAYALANDYNASGDGTYSASPIATTFSGAFEGLGNTISLLSIDADSSEPLVGLFSEIADTGVVRNLHLAETHVLSSCINDGGNCNVAGLAAENSGTLSNDSVSGHLHAGGAAGVYSAGGLVGFNEGTIDGSYSAMNIRATKAYTQGGSNVGSLIGFSSGAVSKSSAAGNVWFSGWGGGGGLVGQNDGSITQSYASGSVSCAKSGCGLAGDLVGEQEGVVSNSYSTGAVSGMSDASGGFVGRGYSGSIADSYSTGSIQSSIYFGGFAGEVDGGTTEHGFWDTTTSGLGNGVGHGSTMGIKGLTTTQFQSGLPKGFSAKIWAENASVNNGLPYLIANPPLK